MRRLALALLALTFLSTAVFADEVIRCESKGNRRRCAFATLGSVGVSVRRNLSIIACVEGTNWGWQHGEIWVDNGCRADFLVFPRRDERREERREERRDSGTTLVCESPEGRYRRCDARIPFGVRINRQFGRADCVKGRNWDYDHDGIWVDHGCKAEFFIEGDRVEEHHRERTRVVCESRDARQVLCSADTRFGVEMARQLSTSECVFRRSWGYNDRGIWVRDGCRAEFFLGTR